MKYFNMFTKNMNQTLKSILVIVSLSLLAMGIFAIYYFINYEVKVDDGNNIISTMGEVQDIPLFIKDKKLIEREGIWDIEITYPSFEGKHELNGLLESFLDNYLALFKESARSYESALSDLSDFDEEFKIIYYLHGQYDKGRFDDKYISFVLVFDYYSGGAHGGRDFYSFAYDLENNKEIFLADLFEENSFYLNDISQYCFNDIQKQIHEKTGDDWVDEEWLKSGLDLDDKNFQAFIFDKESITFYFPPYQLAAYVLGDFKVKFPWVSHLENNDKVGVANPASLNCQYKGGKMILKKNALGDYGVCLFEDNRQCEEWSLFYGYCPDGGVKITGFEYESEIYCAILGGQTMAGASICTFANGKTCLLDDLYQGRCDRNLLSADDELRLYMYVEEHLDRLSPEPAILGGSFHIISLDVLNFDLAEIEYEDGHVSFEADFNFFLTNKDIVVNNFNIKQ